VAVEVLGGGLQQDYPKIASGLEGCAIGRILTDGAGDPDVAAGALDERVADRSTKKRSDPPCSGDREVAIGGLEPPT